ncbi:MAG TPA: hypothetical protein VJV03_14525 [Pyrinomonadaceae bacterium]|nr:hypothetical protein [Pyrinomonadaceae bacterium]
MSSEEPTTATIEPGPRTDARLKRFAIAALVLLIVFLLGFVPMWTSARWRAAERDEARASLRVSTLQNLIANAAIDARRGEYEPARQAASEFLTSLQTEIDRGAASVFNDSQKTSLRPLMDGRDDTITLLARSDPAAADRLVDLFVRYRQAALSTPAR